MVAAAPPAIVQFSVRGNPVTQGSKRGFVQAQPGGGHRAVLVEDGGAKHKEWRALSTTAAKRAMHGALPFAGPVRVLLYFLISPPKTRKADSPWAAALGRDDIDKLSRALLDAMTDAAVFWDDAQVVALLAEKRYCDGFQQPGVAVTVEAL